MRFISKECPPLTKKSLDKEIKHFLGVNNARVYAYYLLDKIRKIVVVQEDTCLIQILQKNVYIPSENEPKELFIND